MICQECEDRQATLHFTKIVNGEKTEFHLCEVCAKEKGEALPGMDNSFSIHHLLSGFLNMEPSGQIGNAYAQKQTLRCKNCGLTYSQFSTSGRFGCSQCYDTFGERLEPLLRKVHGGNLHHRGKIPQRSGIKLKKRREAEASKSELQQAIQDEDFERAARLRDQIRQLERELHEE